MNVLIYSYFPPLRDHLAGGAQRFLDGLLNFLPSASVSVRLLCPPLPGRVLLQESLRCEIIDRLSVVDDDPEPAGAHEDLILLARSCAWADVIVTVDRHFPFATQKPVVLCLNNFSYGPETRSVFNLNWDAVVVPSDYVKRCLKWYFADAAWSGKPRPVHVIPCGMSTNLDPVKCSSAVSDRLGIPASRRILAFLHRPDPDKGFETAVRATLELRRQGHDFTLLAPSPDPDEVWPHQRAYLQNRLQIVEELAAQDIVYFHRWLNATEVLPYLKAASASLCLSELPESFGLAVLEGIAAGTPVVSTPAGAVPELFPRDHGVQFVDFGDHKAVARVIAKGVPEEMLRRGQAYLTKNYNWLQIAESWRRVLSSTQKSSATYMPGPSPNGLQEPWIRQLPSGRVWHDYQKSYIHD